MRNLVVVATVLSTILLLAGCQSSGRGLPRDWPVRELKLADDWQLDQPVARLDKLDPQKYEGQQWAVLFSTEQGFPRAVAYVERCLKPHNYMRKLASGMVTGSEYVPTSFTYYSPDLLTEVTVCQGMELPAQLEKLPINYILSVTVRKEPPQQFSALLEMKDKQPEKYAMILPTVLQPIP